MKAYLNKDEVYPIYSLSEGRGWSDVEIEVSPEFIAEYYSVMVLFDEMQKKLKEYLD